MNHPTADRPSLAPLKWPAYVIAGILFAKPLADAAMAIENFNPGDMQWRLNALGFYSGLLVTPILGLFVALVTGVLLRHVWVARGIAGLCGFMAVLVLAVMVVFTLDALQLRSGVRPDAVTSYYFASARSLANLGMALIALLVMAMSAWKAAAAQTLVRRVQAKNQGETLLHVGSRQLAR